MKFEKEFKNYVKNLSSDIDKYYILWYNLEGVV